MLHHRMLTHISSFHSLLPSRLTHTKYTEQHSMRAYIHIILLYAYICLQLENCFNLVFDFIYVKLLYLQTHIFTNFHIIKNPLIFMTLIYL